MFRKCSLDAQNIAALREHSANIPGIVHASWGRSFIKTLSRRVPEDILKVSLRRLKTSSRDFFWQKQTNLRSYIDFLSAHVLNC